ncbi:MAG TPA: D-alanyl-D-alanine carboxypeptidase, partial [Chitinophagaceae bacterium]|nr:D-alanyl-D-alanine carboxypeptidase [Chitinophagaceae bacterium]
KGILNGFLYLTGSGDPTFGSWRYGSTTPDFFYEKLSKAIQNSGIENDRSHPTSLLFDLSRYSDELFNDNWIWQDLGNYYGISSCALNWRENQFDAIIFPGKNAGDPIKAMKLFPQYVERRLIVNNQLTTGEKGSGDNSYFYYSPGKGSNEYHMDLKGSVPAGVDSFVVSASYPDPRFYFSEFLLPVAANQEIESSMNYPLFGRTAYSYHWEGDSSSIKGYTGKSTMLYEHSSPSLDSIIYWFLQKSINLYGEALIKTFAYHKNGFGSTDSGIVIEKNFWKQKGIDPGELNIRDGSGLSPQNRVTTHAEVEILKYARQQAWFQYFLKAFPESNKMKLKSGSITDVKGFCGYCTSADGTDYIFSFLTNNYTGAPQAVINKMYKVLDSLK